MCLAIPGQITGEIDPTGMAEVDILGVKRFISTLMTPNAVVGDYVMVHAGFAIEVVDEAFTKESLEMLRMIGIKSADELAAEAECAEELAAQNEVPAR